MERAKLQRRLQFLIQLQQLPRPRRPNVKKDVSGLGESFKSVMEMVLLKHCLMFYVMMESCFSAIYP